MTAIRWVLGLGRSGRGRLALAIVLGALASGAAVGLAATSAWLISRASQQPPVLTLMVAIVAVRTFGLARGVLRYLERLMGHDASFRVLGDLRVATVTHLERVLPRRARVDRDRFDEGQLLARFVDDVDGLQDLWVRVLLPYASSALVGAATVVLVAAFVPAAGLVLAISLIVAAVLAPVVSARAARGASARLAPLRGDHQSAVLDLLDGATELAVYGAIDARLDRLDVLDRRLTAAERRSAAAAGVGAGIAALSAGAAMWFGLWFGAGAVDARALAGVSLAVVALVPLAAHEMIAGLASAGQVLPGVASSAARVYEVLHLDPAVVEPPVPTPLPSGVHGLRVAGLRAGWSEDRPDVLRSVDLDLGAGDRVVIAGVSGSGKSTLAAVLLRFLDPSAGQVHLVGDGGAVDITCAAADEVRSVVGWCAQDAYLFDSTIEANLRIARPEATTEELRDALRRARLDDWVDELPEGVLTMIGEHGSQLSGGQRQRLALARVLLADRPIVVFDEPTEHLDDVTAAALASDLLDATTGRTVLVMTHRPELFAGCDRVLELRDGRVAEVCSSDHVRQSFPEELVGQSSDVKVT